jgi:hypothetical protein
LQLNSENLKFGKFRGVSIFRNFIRIMQMRWDDVVQTIRWWGGGGGWEGGSGVEFIGKCDLLGGLSDAIIRSSGHAEGADYFQLATSATSSSVFVF